MPDTLASRKRRIKRCVPHELESSRASYALSSICLAIPRGARTGGWFVQRKNTSRKPWNQAGRQARWFARAAPPKRAGGRRDGKQVFACGVTCFEKYMANKDLFGPLQREGVLFVQHKAKNG